MRKVKLLSIVTAGVLSASLILFACSKDAGLPTPTQQQTSTLKENPGNVYGIIDPSTYISPANPLNEYDAMGKEHNKMLHTFLSENENITESEANIQFVANYFELDQEFVNMAGIVNQYKDADPSLYTGDFLNYYLNNPEVFDYYFRLKDIILNPTTPLAVKLQEVRTLEATFDYANITADQAKVLKVASSIARYSLSYWLPIDQGGQGHADARKIDGWRVARADMVGAWMGAFSTANPFVALGWGAGSSAWDALDQRFS